MKTRNYKIKGSSNRKFPKKPKTRKARNRKARTCKYRERLYNGKCMNLMKGGASPEQIGEAASMRTYTSPGTQTFYALSDIVHSADKLGANTFSSMFRDLTKTEDPRVKKLLEAFNPSYARQLYLEIEKGLQEGTLDPTIYEPYKKELLSDYPHVTIDIPQYNGNWGITKPEVRAVYEELRANRDKGLVRTQPTHSLPPQPQHPPYPQPQYPPYLGAQYPPYLGAQKYGYPQPTQYALPQQPPLLSIPYTRGSNFNYSVPTGQLYASPPPGLSIPMDKSQTSKHDNARPNTM
jgi:hypothetical protein